MNGECFAEHEVSFGRGDGVLRGTLTEPAGHKNGVGLITLHGWGGSRVGPHRMLALLGRDLASEGFTCLRFDFTGRGFSDGEADKSNLDGMVSDTVSAIDFMKHECCVTRVVLAGICSGGNVAIGAETLRRGDIAAMVCLSTLPFAPPPAGRRFSKAFSFIKQYARKACALSTWKRLFRGEASISGAAKVVGDAARGDGAGRSLKDSARDIMSSYAKSRTRALFVYGSNDPEASDARNYYRAFTEEHRIPVFFSEITGANHNFYSKVWSEELRDMAAGFIRDSL